MKHRIHLFSRILLTLFLSLTGKNNISAQVFTVDTILYNGSSSRFINLIFMGDGYQTGQLNTYTTNVLSTANYLFNTSPFSEYKNYFNVFAIRVPSTDAGTDHPGTATDVTEPQFPVVNVNTYFNTTFDFAAIHRLLVTQNTSAQNSVLVTNFPLYDQPLMLVNSPNYGGSGGSNGALASLDVNSFEIMVHELGHSFAGLADEYYAGDIYAAEKANMTQQTNPLLVKWKNWLGYGGVGIYQHCCGGNSAVWYRPHNGCKMRYLGTGYPFCPVCKEALVEKIHQLFGTPVISAQPTQTNIAYCMQPLQFSVTLAKPIPNTLRTKWKLNGNVIASNTGSVTVVSGSLNIGNNFLAVQILDTTALTRDNLHPTNHTYTVNWVIKYSPFSTPTITTNGATTFCQGGSATLTASPANSYSWSNGATTQGIIVSSSGNYSVTVTNSIGCSAISSPTLITVNANPVTPTITNNGAATFCQGGSTTLTASSANSYSWSTGATTQSIIVSASGNYSITVTGTNGCSVVSSPAIITVNVNPVATIGTSGTTTFCEGGNVALMASPATSYSWSNGATTQSIVVSTSGNYFVTTTNASGCPATSSLIAVTVNTVETSVTVNNSTLVSNAGPATYLWVTCPGMQVIPGATNQIFSPSQSGNYAVIVTQNGCTGTSNCYGVLVTTGLSFNNNSTSIVVFPNPANDLITIKGVGLAGDELQMTMTNELGQILTKKQFDIKSGSSENQIDIREFANGIYFLRINSKTVNHVFKIEKQ